MEELGKGRMCVVLGGLWGAVLVGVSPSGLGSVLCQVCWSQTKPALFSISQQQHESSARYGSPWAASGSCGSRKRRGASTVICPKHLSLEINSSGEHLGYFCSPSCSSCAVSLMPGYPGFGDIPRVSIIVLSDVFVSLKGHQAQPGDLGGCCELPQAFPRACRHQE